MRLLVTGGGGQLATDLAALASAAGHTVDAPSRRALDICETNDVRSAVETGRPDVIVNCAAWTAVDACEDNEERAVQVNGTAVGVLAEIAADHGAHLVQLSTDYVFDGTKSAPYVEHDKPNPQSAYGRSKRVGEALAGSTSSVVRTSWVYSKHGGNMAATICRVAAERDTLKFVSDQRGHPTHTVHLAKAVLNIARERASGLWHCTNAGEVSWFEFAQAVMRAAGHDPARVLPILTTDLVPARPAPRPTNSVLANTRYGEHFAPLPDFRDDLHDVVSVYDA